MSSTDAPTPSQASPGPRPPLPNRQCRQCGALLHWHQPPPRDWAPMAALKRGWRRSIPLRLAIVALLGCVAWFVSAAAVGIALLLGLLLHIVRPSGYRPRCPRCRSTDLIAIEVDEAAAADGATDQPASQEARPGSP